MIAHMAESGLIAIVDDDPSVLRALKRLLGAWSYRGLNALGFGLRGISFITVPIIACWLVLSVWLGHKQRIFAQAQRGKRAAPLGDIAAPEAA